MTSWNDYIGKVEATKTVAELEALEHELFGRKSGLMTEAMKGLKDLDAAAKKTAATELNAAKGQLTEALEARKHSLMHPGGDSLASDDSIDVTIDLPKQEPGHLHLVPEFIEQIKEVFGRMGFDVYEGPEIESEHYNFNQLNIPEDHPARDTQDTFWIKSEGDGPEDRYVLRTHTSPGQVRYMQEREPPFRAIFPGKVYRKDADATHSPMFHQFEGLMVGKDITMAHLETVLVKGLQELIGRDVEARFRTGFFPFTEPSLEMDMMWQGDMEDSREGKWLEMGGCGMIHPTVLKNSGIDPEEWQGFAFGFGVERPLMIKHQIPDLRLMFQGDQRFLRQF